MSKKILKWLTPFAIVQTMFIILELIRMFANIMVA